MGFNFVSIQGDIFVVDGEVRGEAVATGTGGHEVEVLGGLRGLGRFDGPRAGDGDGSRS